MRKLVSARRQKQTKVQAIAIKTVENTLLQGVDEKPQSDKPMQNDMEQQIDVIRSMQSDSKLLLEKIDILLLEQQRAKDSFAEAEKTQDELKNIIISLQSEVGVLKKTYSSITENIQALFSKLDNKSLLSEILTEIKVAKNIHREDYKTILNVLLNKKQDVDTERTISFQLGKTIIDGTKNVNSIIGLPKKLLDLRKESLKRKDKTIVSVIEGKAVEKKVLSTAVSTVNKVTLDELLNNNKKQKTDGNLLLGLSLKNHELVGFGKNQEGITITSKMVIEKPRYFYSSNMIDLASLSDYIHNKKMTILFESESNGLNVEVIINYLNEAKEKISFSMAKPASKIFMNIPDECKHISLGIKVSGNGTFQIKKIKLQEITKSNDVIVKKNKLNEGVSVIIPSYKGDETILDTLNSIKQQKSINLDLVEVVCVINGPVSKTERVLKKFIKDNPQINLKMLYSDIASASQARNVGINNATKEFLIFLDDDDTITENYLSDMYALAGNNTVVFSYIHDLDASGNIQKETNITKQLVQNKDNVNINGLSSAVTMIASKMLPTADIQQVIFDPKLRSGEDVSYFVEYMVKFNPTFKLVEDIDCAYIRRITDNSVSRQPMSFNFNVEQRLDVIKSLDLIMSNYAGHLAGFVVSKMKAQIGFIIRYLTEHPQELDKVLEQIIQRKIYHFPYKYFWEKVGKNEVKQLVFSYCHPPFVDTSATIVGKRVQEFGLLSDVIANDMSSLRKVDEDMMFLNKHLINDINFLQTETSFGGWRAIKEFSEQANKLVEGKFYSQIYSRVLWPGSNFAAAIYKSKNPQTKWIAEFSDPAVLDIHGKERSSLLDDKTWVEEILAKVPSNIKNHLLGENNLYVWCELLAYLFADEIIFTCENQRKVMLDSFKYKDIAQLAYKKSVIKQHPTLPKAFYQLGQGEYNIDHNYINIGYFGVFYANRNLNDFIEVIQQINQQKQVKKKIKLHIFTNAPQDFVGQYGEHIIFNSYLGYFDFLSTSNTFDYLLVNDAVVSDIFGINPYLPSKVSDYKGADAKIIALVERGSALSKMRNIPVKLYLGSEYSFLEKLQGLVNHETISSC
ncbi:glycosyltransferase [Acinetobacter rudis]|uniref:glycosyltransferase n=1 Tax=Acinetobacter rudis TaxID=632955 RepID=UPI00280C8639|nr:glycosyltransferase [Acinetobacter rudis]MDQ8954035.1 glycosyltransferase [Acinetobacter rudis]